MNPIRLNRRTVLRGAGVAVALPTLNAMLTDKGLLYGTAGAQARKAPTRLVIFFIPNGVSMADWVPVTTGAGFALRRCMEPLTPFRDDINVLSGIDLEVHGAGGGHEWGTSGFATCMNNSPSGAGGPSMEQVAAQHLGDATKFRSLVVSDNTVPAKYDTNLSYISYSAASTPVPPIRDPRALFDKVFKGMQPQGPASSPSDIVSRRRSVLDFVKGDLGRLDRVLGTSDRQRLDAHLSGVRELERQLDLVSSGAASPVCAAPAEPTVDGAKYSDEAELLLLDMTALALKCDLTRYASFMVAFGGASAGPAPAQHALTHARDFEKTVPITQRQVAFFAHLLGRLKDDTAQEAGGTVLDNSLLYLGSEMSDGAAHTNDNLPIVLAGKAGGQVKTGRHIAYPTKTLMSKMMLAMLKFGGVPVDEFAGMREPLSGLDT
jgi:Protein of unknown function (DUF1552)